MASLAKAIIVLGVFLIVLGGTLLLAGKVTGFGKLPGDLHIQHKNFSLYFPITTCILLSIALTIILHFVLRR